ncbi:MAG: hypothetical protein JSV03_02920, partial [Planctomycetota bacterium]
LAYARPIPWAIIHIGERSRNARLVPKDSKLAARQVRFNDFRKMWREVFSPALGAFQALKEEHIPWVTLTDDALAQSLAPDSRLLILPWPEELNTQQQKTVERFEKQGGYVIRINPAAGWHTKSGKSGLVKNLRRIIRQQSGSAPIQIDSPERMHTVCYHNPNTKRYTVCLANTWGWFRSTRVPDPKLNQGTEPLPCTGVAIKFSKSIGQPKKVFEVLSGKQLIIKPSDNDVQVQIPEFQIMACVVAEY